MHSASGRTPWEEQASVVRRAAVPHLHGEGRKSSKHSAKSGEDCLFMGGCTAGVSVCRKQCCEAAPVFLTPARPHHKEEDARLVLRVVRVAHVAVQGRQAASSSTGRGVCW